MVWTPTIRFVEGDPLTAAQLNTFIRDNLNSSAAGIATTPGAYITTLGRNQLVERQWVHATLGGVVTSSGEWPSDPDQEEDPGPSVTFEHGGSFLAFYECRIILTAAGGTINYAPVPDSAPLELMESQGPEENYVYGMAVRTTRTSYDRMGAHMFFEGYKPGTTTLTMKYGRTPGTTGSTATGEYAQRRLSVLPL